MIVSAHDGYPRWVNSGADFIEVDVRRASDGTIVLSHDPLKPGKRYSTLEEVLQATTGRIGIQLDLKEPGYEIDAMRMTAGARSAVVVTTPFEESIRLVKQVFPDTRCGLTSQFIEKADVDFIALDQRYATEEALAFGMPLWIWTVDDTKLMERLINDPRVDGIITNKRALALKLRRARS